MKIETSLLQTESLEDDVLLAYISSTCYAFAEDLMDMYGDVFEIGFTVKQVDPYRKG